MASVRRSVDAVAPVTLQVELTNHCNLRCAMCFQQTMQRPARHMTRETFHSVVDQAVGWTRHLQLANFGEPLLHPHVYELVAHAAGRGLFVDMITNGTLLDRAAAEELVAAGVGKVSVSVDSLDPARFLQLRGVELDAVLAGVRRLERARRRAGTRAPFIVLSGTDLVSNHGDGETLRRRCRSLGADACYVTPSCNWAGGATDPRWIKPHGADVAGCPFPWEFCFVGSAGEVAPCCIDPELRHRVGQIATGDLRGQWNGAAMHRLRAALLHGDLEALSRVSACAGCSRLFGSPAAMAVNRARVELAQLSHFARLSFHRKRAY